MSIVLIPPDRDVGWTPYVFLLYLVFVFIQPIAEGASPSRWAITIAAVLLFLPLYFTGYWVIGRRGLLVVAAIAAIGCILLPFNFGGMAFLIFAAAFLGFMFEPVDGFKLLAAMLACVALELFLLHFPVWAWVNGLMIDRK